MSSSGETNDNSSTQNKNSNSPPKSTKSTNASNSSKNRSQKVFLKFEYKVPSRMFWQKKHFLYDQVSAEIAIEIAVTITQIQQFPRRVAVLIE